MTAPIPPEHLSWDPYGDFRATAESFCACSLCAEYRATATETEETP